MKVNLKKIYQYSVLIDVLIGDREDNNFVKHLKNLKRLLQEIETDLSLSGESIVELDKDRLKSIKERNSVMIYK